MPGSRLAAIVSALAVLFTVHGRAEAGAWAQKRGEGLIISTLSWHELAAPGDRAILHKQEAALYGEYGLTSRITLVGRFALQGFTEEPAPDSAQAKSGKSKPAASALYAIGGSELGARLALFEHERWAGAVQIVSTLPSAGENRNNAQPGEGGGDIDARLLLGRAIGEAGFAEFQLGYRERGEDADGEVRLDTAFGWPVTGRVSAHLQTYSVWSSGVDITRFREFSGHRLQLSLIADLGRGRYAQLGAISTVRAHQMAEENAVLAAIWQRF